MSPPSCPTCGEPLASDARMCRSCGASLPGQTDISCSTCGHANPADSSFCRTCGQPLDAAEPGAPGTEPTLAQTPQRPAPLPGPRISAGMVVAIVLGVVLVAGGGVAAALLLAGGHSHPPTLALAGTSPSTTTVTETTVSRSSAGEASTAGAGTGASEGATGKSTGDARVFHTQSGNVACEVQAESARCAVASSQQTFVLPEGHGRAYTQYGLALPVGSGFLAPYGASLRVGSVTCAIPRQNEPKGIICASNRSRHGFEASKVPSRQRVY
jgi:Double zinc ribbon